MDYLEEAVRQTLRGRVAVTPPADGLADKAIAGARRRRATQVTITAVLCLLVGAGVAVGVGARGPEGRAPAGIAGSPTLTVTGLPTEMVIGDYLVSPDGELSRWDQFHPVSDAWRVDGGRLIFSGANALWYLPDGGAPPVKLADASVVVVTREADMIEVAWDDGERLHVGALADGALAETASTAQPSIDGTLLWPRAVVGDVVVLAGSQTGGGLDVWDTWLPHEGDYVPDRRPTVNLLGVTGGGLLARTGGCLRLLDPADFTPTRSLCSWPLGDFDEIFPSPDGRWWMTLGEHGAHLFDASTVWDSDDPVRGWSNVDTFADGQGFWIDASSFMAVRDKASDPITLHTDGRPDEAATIPTGDWYGAGDPGMQRQPTVEVVADLR